MTLKWNVHYPCKNIYSQNDCFTYAIYCLLFKHQCYCTVHLITKNDNLEYEPQIVTSYLKVSHMLIRWISVEQYTVFIPF